MSNQVEINIKDIREAQETIKEVVHRTPLNYSTTLSNISGNQIYLKEESSQKTGSFKIRGAYYKISKLSEEQKKAGVIAASAGNHAQGVAYAASKAGIKATIVMPQGAPITKVMATKNYQAQIVLSGQGYDEAYDKAIDLQKETKATFIHAFNDPDIIAGQGTIGLEILEDLPNVDAIVVPIGGGGLISGVAIAAKKLKPGIKIIGVQSEGCPSMKDSLDIGHIEEVPFANTIADGIAVKRPGESTYEYVKKYVDHIVTVNDEEIAGAILFLMERNKVITEAAGAVGVAALLNNKIKLNNSRVAIVLSGGNIDVNMISNIIERGLVKGGRIIELKTTLIDKPGALQRFLGVIADTKANVISIYHNRILPHVPINKAEVEITLETRDCEHIEEIRGILMKKGYNMELIK